MRNNCYKEKGTCILNPRVTNTNEGHDNLGHSLYSFSSYINRCFLMYANYSVLCNKREEEKKENLIGLVNTFLGDLVSPTAT